MIRIYQVSLLKNYDKIIHKSENIRSKIYISIRNNLRQHAATAIFIFKKGPKIIYVSRMKFREVLLVFL